MRSKYIEQIKNLESRVIEQRKEIRRLNIRRDTVEQDLKNKLKQQQKDCDNCWLLEQIISNKCIQKAVLKELRIRLEPIQEISGTGFQVGKIEVRDYKKEEQA